MFNNNYNHSTEYIPYTKSVDVRVTEIRAATDESIKIYKEMEDKAQKSFIDRRSIPNNIVKGEYYIFYDMWDYKIFFCI